MPENHIILGLTGFARCGKDTAALHLVRHHGFVQMSFAHTLKQFTYDADPFVQLNDGTFIRYAQLIDDIGVDKAKAHHDVRRLLQRIGTEGGRNNIHPNVWVDPVIAAAQASSRPVVISDVRFANEAAAVQAAGGVVARIHRPGYAPVNDHTSDTGIAALSIDHDIANAGTIDDLAGEVDALLALI